MTEVIMPKMGDGMEEGILLEWLKKEGDSVKSGEAIATIQTDKATLEMEADGSGVLAGILIKAGETVPVGEPLALLLKEGESVPAGWGTAEALPVAAPSEPASVAAVAAVTAGPTIPTPPVEIPEPRAVSSDRVKASPLARKIAEELGVDLSQISGSGPGGRVVEKDVRGATRLSVQPSLAPTPAQAPTPIAAAAEDRFVSLNKIRQITAQRTTQSKQTVPHFYVTVEVDCERMQSLREQFESDGAGKVSINDFVIKACAQALVEMPQVNATFQGDKILQFGAVNIGMAVALEDGLTVPVLHGAQNLSIRQISAKSKELAAKARENRLSMDEISGSTFSISNMGMLGVDNFAAIINVPNAAIVAVSSAKKLVVPVEAEGSDEVTLEVRLRMNVTGSFDHRVVDGAIGAKFMNVVRDYLQNPTRLLG
ncbi:MAG: 2-oxo acid dehydrogenase subunit E2 [Armatimonadetes bacterium]|nr:2-oxo acid dehydrogenase subunit E2 [Armatimonadota bacterium]